MFCLFLLVGVGVAAPRGKSTRCLHFVLILCGKKIENRYKTQCFCFPAPLAKYEEITCWPFWMVRPHLWVLMSLYMKFLSGVKQMCITAFRCSGYDNGKDCSGCFCRFVTPCNSRHQENSPLSNWQAHQILKTTLSSPTKATQEELLDAILVSNLHFLVYPSSFPFGMKKLFWLVFWIWLNSILSVLQVISQRLKLHLSYTAAARPPPNKPVNENDSEGLCIFLVTVA